MKTPSRTAGGLLLLFGIASLAAVAAGAFACAASGVPAGSWIRNVAAWLAGGVAAAGLAAGPHKAAPAFLALTPLGLLATLFSPDQGGVHRWVDAGPLQVNVAMLLLPPAVVALAALGGARRWPWAAAFAALVVLAAQPDPSQATALAGAMALIAACGRWPLKAKLLLVAGAAALAAVAWSRPNPLEPVPEVEEIIGLAASVSPFLAAFALLSLLVVVAAPVITTRAAPPVERVAAAALALCLALWILTPALGAFPVPLVGIGMSSIVGAWLGAGLLAGLLGREPRPAL